MANYKIYLSSTFKDLEIYRKAILELFKYISNDFQITAMEGYTADDVSVVDKCRADVRQCDVYVLLLANRYGFLPVNENPERKSITEIEYDTAVEKKKRLLVYLADLNNKEGVKFDEDNDENAELRSYKKEKLRAFLTEVSKGDKFTPTIFLKPDDLSAKISASLIRMIMGNPAVQKKKINENLRYCCDRSDQFITYEQNKISGSSLFHVFITSGHEFDTGGNLANRCAIFSLSLAEQEILPLGFEEFYNSESYERNLNQFIFQLHRKLVPEKELSKSSLPELRTALIEIKSRNVVIRINCYQEYLDDSKVEFLVSVFNELHQMCSAMYAEFRKRIYFFLNVIDNYETSQDMARTDQTIDALVKEAEPYRMNLVKLPRFHMANKEHIKNWIENYLTRDTERRDELYDRHFAEDLGPSFRLRVAEKSIRRLFARIQEEDATIMNLINKEP